VVLPELQRLRELKFFADGFRRRVLCSRIFAIWNDCWSTTRRLRANVVIRRLHSSLESWRTFAKRKQAKRNSMERATENYNFHLIRRSVLGFQSFSKQRVIGRSLKERALSFNRQRSLLRALMSFKDVTDDLGRRRLVLSRAHTLRRTRLLKRCWASWTERSRDLAEKRRLLSHAHSLRRTHFLRTYWRWWVVRSKDLKRKRDMFAQAQKFRIGHLMIDHWACWLDTFEYLRRKYEQARELRAALGKRLVSASFRQMRAIIVREVRLRRCMEGVIKRWRALEMAVAFSTWRGELTLKRNSHRALGYWQKTALVRAWNGWVFQLRSLQDLRVRSKKRVMSLSFSSFHAFAQQQRHYRELDERALRHWERRSLLRVWGVWMSWLEQRANMRKATWEMQRRQVGKLLRRWREELQLVVRQRQNAEERRMLMQRRLLSFSFSSLRSHVREARDEAAKTLIAERFCSKRKLTMAWKSWRLYTAYWRTLYTTATMRQQALHQRIISASFLDFKDFVRTQNAKKSQLQKAVGHWRSLSMSQAFQCWKGEFLWLREAERLVRERRRSFVRQLMSESFERMRQNAQVQVHSRQAKEKAFVYWKLCAEGRVWRAWRRYVSDSTRQSHQRAQWMERSKSIYVGSSFRTWLQYLERVKALEQRADTFKSTLTRRKMTSSFMQISAYCKQRALRRQRMEHAIVHWKKFSVARALLRWKEYSRERQRLRSDLSSALQNWRLLSLATAMRSWHEAFALVQDRKQKMRLVEARWRRSQYARVLMGWREAVARKKHKREIVGRAVSVWRGQTLARTLRQWRWVITRHAHLEHSRRELIDSRYARSLRGAFDSWRASFSRDKMFAAAALTQWQNNLLTTVWTCWKEELYSSVNNSQELADSAFHTNLAARALRAWSTFAKRQTVRRRCDELAKGMFIQRQMLAFWERWVQGTALRRARRRAIGDASMRRLLKASFNGMRECVGKEIRRRDLLRTMLLRWRARMLTTAWNSWKRKLQSRRVTVKALRFWQQRAVVRAWNAWTTETALMHAIHDSKRRKLMSISIQMLRSFTSTRREKGELNRKASVQWRRRILIRVWTTWLSKLERKASARQAIWHWQHRAVARLWAVWNSEVARRIRCREDAEQRRLILQHRLLSFSFSSLREHLQQTRDDQGKSKVADRFWSKRKLSMAWKSWRLYTVYCKSLYGAADVRRQIFSQRVLSSSFSGFKDFVRENRVKKKMLERSLGYWRFTALARAFRSWKDEYVWLREAERIVRERRQSFHRQLMTASFVQMREHAQMQVQKRVTVDRAYRFWRTVILGRAWLGWKKYIFDYMRKYKLRLQWIESSQRVAKAASFHAWFHHLDRSRTMLKRADEFAHILARRRLGASFSVLCTMSRIQRQNKAKALQHWRSASAGRAFRRWRNYVYERHELHTTLVRVLSMWTYRRLARAMRTWRGALAIEMERERTMSNVLSRWRRGQSARLFKGWRDASLGRKERRRTVIQTLTRFEKLNTERLLSRSFTHWRTVCVQQKLGHMLLEQTVRTLLSRILHRWSEYAGKERAWRGKLWQAGKFRRRQMLYSAFRTWARNTVRLRHNELEMSIAREIQQKQMANTFAQWREMARALKAHEVLRVWQRDLQDELHAMNKVLHDFDN